MKEMYLQGAKDQARDLLAEYVKGKPKDASAWTVLGNCYRDLDQDALAEQAYQTALQLDRKATGAYIGLGVIARKREDYNKALDYYIQALKVEPSSAKAWTSAAIVAMKLSDDGKAVEFAEHAWELDKSDAGIAANLCIAYHYAGRLKDRDRMYQQARRLKYSDMETIDKIFSGEYTMRA
jgi:Flp pilus assembly protein TadD